MFTPRPLGPLYDIAHQTQGSLLALLEEEARRASVFSAALDDMKRGRAPSVAVIEDVDRADEATLDLLKFLWRRINRITCMLVVTYRDDEVGADHPLRLVPGDLPRRAVACLRLPPLSEAGVNALAESAGRPAGELYAVTGNIAGGQISGTIPLASVPAGSASYIRNTTTQQAASNFNINGDGTAGGKLTGNVANATSVFTPNGTPVLHNNVDSLVVGVFAGGSSGGRANTFVGFDA